MKLYKTFIFLFFSVISLSLYADVSTKRAVVAGGAGFLGSHLCDRLIEEEYDVICIDNFCTGKLKNIEHLKDNPHFSLIHKDITIPIIIEGVVDEIYNLACPASPPKYQKDPVHTLKTNFMGTLNLLELAKAKKALFFQASTSEVYGDPLLHPQVEGYWGNVNPIGIRACYDEGKRVAETLCFEYYRSHNLKIKVARIFNTYGPRMADDDGRVVSNFVVQAISGTPLTVYGDGSQTRSFCYVDDLIEGFRKLMKSEQSITGPVNLGNPNETTMSEFASFVSLKTSSDSEIKFFPLPKDDPTRRKPDISYAKKHLNWQPKVELEEGLEKTIEYFSNEQKKQINRSF